MLDMFSTDQQNALDAASRSPIPTQGTTPGEAFSAAVDANVHGSAMLAESANSYNFVQTQLDRYQQRTGERIANPLGIDPGQPSMDDVRTRFASKAKELGDPSLTFPSDDDIHANAVATARQALTRQQQLQQGQQNFGAGVAGFAGNLVAGAVDPMNALAIATIPEGGLAVKMLGAAASFGGTTLASDLASYGFKKEVDPNFGPGDVVKDTALSALGGAGFEAIGPVLGAAARYTGLDAVPGALWRRIKGTAPQLAEAMPTAVADAGNVAERVADLGANNPFPIGPAGEAAHNAAVVSVERDLMAGRTPTLPPEAVDALSTPTTAQLDRHAATLAPDLYSRATDLDGQIAEARSALAARPTSADTLAASQADVAGRLSDLQNRIATFTDAERKSPEGLATLGEVQRLQQSPDAIHVAAQASAFEAEQALRLRLNDLQQQRGALGPDINAARQTASVDLAGAPPSAPVRAQPATPADVARAYGDTSTIDAAAAHPYQGVRRISQALTDATPAWNTMRDAASRGLIPPTSDITADLMGAVRTIVQARNEGRTLADVFNLGDQFHSDMAQTAAKLFFKDGEPGKFLSRSQMAGNLRDLADGLRGGPQVIENIPLKTEANSIVADPTIRPGIQDATAPKAVEAAFASPTVRQAAEASLQRSIEAGRTAVPTVDGAGNMALGDARAELAAINDELAASQAIASCNLPKAA